MADHGSSSRGLLPLPLRFSIRSLLIATAAVAALIPLGGYLLRTASTWTAAMTVLVTALVLAGALCLAVNRQGATRSYWAGFAIFGLTYFIVAGDPWSSPYNYELFTETISIDIWAHYFSTPEDADSTPEEEPAAQPDGPTGGLADAPLDSTLLDGVFDGGFPEVRDFVMVAHMFWSLAFAFIGGWVSLLMYWTGQRTQKSPD
jgi:hypothetical protein